MLTIFQAPLLLFSKIILVTFVVRVNRAGAKASYSANTFDSIWYLEEVTVPPTLKVWLHIIFSASDRFSEILYENYVVQNSHI